MEVIMKWVNEKLSKPLAKVTSMRGIASIMTGFQNTIGLIIVGALIQIVVNLTSLAGINTNLQMAYNLTLGVIALYLSFTIGSAMARHHQIKSVMAGLSSIAAFLVFQRPTLSDTGLLQLNFSQLGTTGFFIAIVAGLFGGEVVGQFLKRNWTLGGRSLPDMVKEWFTPIVPLSIVVLGAWILAYPLNIDIFNLLQRVITPVLSTANTYPAFLLLCLFMAALFIIGINPAMTFGVLIPLWMASVGQNAALAAQGLQPANINTLQTIMGWVVLGGTGCTIVLNLMMLRSKSPSLKALGKASIAPSIMNINEPLIFGIPIAFNPILAIPFILCSGIVNPTLAYITMSNGLVTPPFIPLIMPWAPNGLNGYLFNNDWRGIVLYVLLFAIDFIIWYPFFKGYEKIMTEKGE